MNGPHTPAFRRDNIWTRVIERAAEQNASEGKPAGRMLEQMAGTHPLISAAKVKRMSPAERVRTDYVPEMDTQALMQSSARASALGLTNDGNDNDDLPGDIGHVAGDNPSDREIDAMLRRASGGPVPGALEGGEGAAAPGAALSAPQAAGRVTLPRGATAPQMGLAGPRTMPDFTRVEGFDLTRKVAVVDGMEFKLAEEDVSAMKRFAIQVVLDNVTYQLAQALVALGVPKEMAEKTAATMRETAAAGATPGGMVHGGVGAGVQAVSDGKAAGAVQPGAGGLSIVPGTASADAGQGAAGSSVRASETWAAEGATDDAGMLLGDGGLTPS